MHLLLKSIENPSYKRNLEIQKAERDTIEKEEKRPASSKEYE